MQENDARRLDHHTLEALRERAVRKVQEGESPEVIARVLGLNGSTVYGWLVQYRRGGWGALKAKPLFGRPPKCRDMPLRAALFNRRNNPPAKFKRIGSPHTCWPPSPSSMLNQIHITLGIWRLL
jgi:hypothetical protein